MSNQAEARAVVLRGRMDIMRELNLVNTPEDKAFFASLDARATELEKEGRALGKERRWSGDHYRLKVRAIRATL